MSQRRLLRLRLRQVNGEKNNKASHGEEKTCPPTKSATTIAQLLLSSIRNRLVTTARSYSASSMSFVASRCRTNMSSSVPSHTKNGTLVYSPASQGSRSNSSKARSSPTSKTPSVRSSGGGGKNTQEKNWNKT